MFTIMNKCTERNITKKLAPVLTILNRYSERNPQGHGQQRGHK